MAAKYKNFGTELLYSADVNDYLMRQVTILVANSAERATIPSPYEGMQCYQIDIHAVLTYNGTTWSTWRTVTPSFTGITVGSGAMYGRYQRIGNMVTYMGNWTFGTGSVITTNPSLNLPIPSISGIYSANQIVGTAALNDNGSTWQMGWMRWGSTTTAQIIPYAGTGLAANTPWVWTIGDNIGWQITYEAAS